MTNTPPAAPVFCKDCAHCQPYPFGPYQCSAPAALGLNLVTGGFHTRPCGDMRSAGRSGYDEGLCGPSGKLFAPSSDLTNNLVPSQPSQALAVGAPVSGAGSGHATVVVEVYAIGRGVCIERQGANLSGAQGAFELEGDGVIVAFYPIFSSKANWPVLTVESYIAAVGLQLETVDQQYVSDACRGFVHEGAQSKTAILSLPLFSGNSALAHKLRSLLGREHIVAHSLAAMLGCKYIVEEWSPRRPLLAGALHLTNVDLQVMSE